MTLYEFNRFSFLHQLSIALTEGIHLATRWDVGQPVRLYHLPGGIFVELYYDTDASGIMRLSARSFISSAPLEKYVEAIQLPEGRNN